MTDSVHIYLAGGVALTADRRGVQFLIDGYAFKLTSLSIIDVDSRGNKLREGYLQLGIVEIPRESPKPTKRRWSTSMGLRKPK